MTLHTDWMRPLGAARNLTEALVQRLSEGIRSGELTPGDRLPTEQSLMTALGVSRTVVREAVAALRAEGLVVTRQGSGAFVASDPARQPFRLTPAPLDPEGLASIDDVIGVMELRVAVEVESAGLAAERATHVTVARIDQAVRDFDRAVREGEGAVEQDFALHLAIAQATGNPHFASFLTFLGRHVIPRQTVRLEVGSPAERAAYLEQIRREHHRITAAITAQDGAEARRAMRVHLAKSLQRYRGLAESFGSKARRPRETGAKAGTSDRGKLQAAPQPHEGEKR